MINIAKMIGRFLAVLISKNIISEDESLYILEPLKENEVMTDE